MSEPYFATGYVRLLFRLVGSERASAQQLFEGTGCCEADLMRADYEMPFTAQMRFCENALAYAGPSLGLKVGYQLQLAAHGALGTAMQSAPDLRSALATLVQFIPARASFFSMTLVEADKLAAVEIATSDLSKRLVPFFSESILFTLTHCLIFYTGQPGSVEGIQLTYPPPDYKLDYGAAFGEPIEFNSTRTRITFDRTLLSLPSPEADAIAFAESVRRCKEQIDQRQVSDDVARGIETFLLENPGKLWTVDEIAPLFAMSPRTLIRKLKVHGTTYQRLRDDAFKRQAVIYLRSMSVEATALSLGFADTSSFRRTFKRWFGVTPSAF